MIKKDIPKEYIDLLNIDKILENTLNIDKLKVILKHDAIKGSGLYATKPIKTGETIAFYKMTVFDYRHYISPTNYIYAFDVYTLTGKESKNLIGDVDLNSFPSPIDDIPFWAAFVNEPSIGQKLNAEINLNTSENYKTNKIMRRGKPLIYKLVASCDISEGDEITIYYGKDYIRNYSIDIIETA